MDYDAIVFHAGTKLLDGAVVSDGGRVLTIVAMGESLDEARNHAYEGIRHITFKDVFYRTDIASFEHSSS